MIELNIVSPNKTYKQYRPLLTKLHHYGGIIAGGFPRSLVSKISKNYFSDIDIFFRNRGALDKILKEIERGFFLQMIGPHFYKVDRISKLNPSLYNPYVVHSLLVSRVGVMSKKNVAIQFIERFGTPEDIIEDFDMSASKAILDPVRDVVFITEDFLETEKSKQLTFNNKVIKDRAAWGYRLSKYITDYKYKITDSSISQVVASMQDDYRYGLMEILEDSGIINKKEFPKSYFIYEMLEL